MVFRSSRPRRPFRFPVRYLRVHSLAARLHAGVMVGALCLGLGVVTAVCATGCQQGGVCDHSSVGSGGR